MTRMVSIIDYVTITNHNFRILSDSVSDARRRYLGSASAIPPITTKIAMIDDLMPNPQTWAVLDGHF
jgi:hypothetical protein